MSFRFFLHVRCAFLPAMAIALSACSGGPKDDWYEYSSDVDARKKEYVRQAMIAGSTEAEAKREFGIIYSIELTGKRDPIEVTRDDLDRIMMEANQAEAEAVKSSPPDYPLPNSP